MLNVVGIAFRNMYVWSGVWQGGFEKALLMQTSANMAVSEIISTYVYKVGIQWGQYSFGP
ncbi:hypothetical protein [Acutalibacter muris]|uniref:hypothetical protein n=1 Tax=Acutalibacter muris TaxID=1796620 RepID=UPI00272AF880|nr:hypothetical protein [Acutalibacter muris]